MYLMKDAFKANERRWFFGGYDDYFLGFAYAHESGTGNNIKADVCRF